MTTSPAPRRPESPGASATSGAHALVLVRGSARASARWLRQGLVAVAAVELPGWIGIVPTELSARSRPPYDDALQMLAARPVPMHRRPAIGFFVIDGCAVLTIQPRRGRPVQEWLVWQPGVGVRPTPALAALSVGHLASAAGAPAAAPDVARVLRALDGDPLDLLGTVLTALRLPGEAILRHGAPSSVLGVEPDHAAVRRFDRLIHNDDEPEVMAP